MRLTRPGAKARTRGPGGAAVTAGGPGARWSIAPDAPDRTPAPAPRPAPVEVLTGFESTYLPAFDVDVAETTGHAERWRDDLALVRASGVRRLRYPVRWHRVEPAPGAYDWRATDEVLAHLAGAGLGPIVDLCHHTSYPAWTGGFGDPGFGPAYLRFVDAFAARYPDVAGYTLFNEPFTTFLLCGHEGVWPPHWRGVEGLVRVARNVLPAVAEASRRLHERLPGARHVHVEACERHTSAGRAGAAMAALANDRRFLLTDLLVGLPVDPARPFARRVAAAGGDDLLAMEPGHVDVLGLDYYAHNQWHWSGPDRGTPVAPAPAPLADLLGEYAARYGLPVLVGETNLRGFATDRATWLRYTLEQCEQARLAGVAVEGLCWFPFVDSCDWDSRLTRWRGHVDPVGVYWLDAGLERRPSEMSDAFAMAAAGAPASTLPAYRLRPPVADRLRGWLPHVRHWTWTG